MRVRLIGIGTRHGDDAAGLDVVDALQAEGLPEGVEAVLCQRPGLDLPEALGGFPAAVLVDAMTSGRPPGEVRRVSPEELPRWRALSSHGLGVAEGLALAQALGREPARLELVGIEAQSGDTTGLSPAARRGVVRATRLVRELVRELASDRDA